MPPCRPKAYPNIFLYASLASGLAEVDNIVAGSYVVSPQGSGLRLSSLSIQRMARKHDPSFPAAQVFWSAFIFYVAPALEQMIIVRYTGCDTKG